MPRLPALCSQNAGRNGEHDNQMPKEVEWSRQRRRQDGVWEGVFPPQPIIGNLWSARSITCAFTCYLVPSETQIRNYSVKSGSEVKTAIRSIFSQWGWILSWIGCVANAREAAHGLWWSAGMLGNFSPAEITCTGDFMFSCFMFMCITSLL